MRKPVALHWLLIVAFVSFALAYRRQTLDVVYGWPFMYAMDQWDVGSHRIMPFGIDYFRLLPFVGNVMLGAAVGFAVAELARRILDYSAKK